VGHEFGAPALDHIAGLGENIFQKFEKVAEAGFLINCLGHRPTQGGIRLDVSGGAQCTGARFVFASGWSHATMLHPRAAKCKGSSESHEEKHLHLLEGHQAPSFCRIGHYRWRAGAFGEHKNSKLQESTRDATTRAVYGFACGCTGFR
jgi:hypothetical protein